MNCGAGGRARGEGVISGLCNWVDRVILRLGIHRAEFGEKDEFNSGIHKICGTCGIPIWRYPVGHRVMGEIHVTYTHKVAISVNSNCSHWNACL